MKNIYSVMAVVFIAFFIIGMALPVLPLHVHNTLEFGSTVIGIVSGSQFLASVFSRLKAGQLADARGPRTAVSLGLKCAIAGGVLYLISCTLIHDPDWSVAAIIIGRALIGGAESLIITGAMAWSLVLSPAGQSGRVIALTGLAMFAAMATGAPAGSLIYALSGFAGISLVTALFPLVALVIASRMPSGHRPEKPAGHKESVRHAVTIPGIAFALSGITFGAVTSFLTLYFYLKQWDFGSVAFSAFAFALILMRFAFGHLPDRLGGAKVACFSLLIQAAGLLTIAFAGNAYMAIAGAAIGGAGFSLVFPALATEVVSRVSPHSRGSALGIYNVFLDVTLGIGSPLLGFSASQLGVNSVFIISAVASLIAIPVTFRLFRHA